MKISRHIWALCIAVSGLAASAGVVQVGSGSYSDVFPGKDNAGRNGYPAGEPQISGKAVGRPVPTNEWWSNELLSNHGQSSYAYTLSLSPRDGGLVIMKPIAGGAMSADTPLMVALSSTNSPQTTVCDYSDWTVTLSWNNGAMTATAGMGMPFVYFNRTTSDNVVVTAGMGTAQVVDGNIIVVSGSYNGANYAVYAPSGATWSQNGNTFTSTLNGKNYWSAAMLPDGDAVALARAFKQYAYAFPTDTRAEFTYDENAGKVRATYTVTTEAKEGSNKTTLMGLLPHHYNNISGNPNYTGHTYSSVRGTIKLAATNSFTTELRYGGVLPTIPAAQTSASGYSSTELQSLANAVFDNSGLSDWTDSYNDGQLLNRLVQTARICKEAGYEAGFNRGLQLVKNHLEKWLKYDEGEKAFMFYYHKPYTALLGYPAGHGQDTNINDHHFHWGYFIHAAAFVEQYNPGWANNWGEMVGMLVRDAASNDRNDSLFPYLRSFSPYAGHCWANGFATDPTGNDQESTSESMQFNCSLIHWGAVTGNKAIRDLGVCLYTIERSATEDYWFNINSALPSNGHALYSRIFGNRYDSSNFWGAPIEGSYGIQVYPVHAGSFYLVNNPTYAKKLWDAMCSETQILSNQANDNLWYDCWIQFLSMIDPSKALQLYNSCTQLGKKFGISQAQTYQQVHAMAALGVPRQDITANNPLATAFDNNGQMTYACHNYSDQTVTVRFSDGYELVCPPRQLTTSVSSTPSKRDAYVTVNLSSVKVKAGEKVTIDVTIDEGDHTIVKSAIKVNGESVNEKQHSVAARASKSHTHDWTAPETAGSYTVTAEAVNSEGRVFASLPQTVTVTASSSPDPGTDPSDVPAAPTPTKAAGNVMSIFSDKYTSAFTNFMVGTWGQATKTETVKCGGDDALKLTDFNYLGLQNSNDATIDASGMQYIHIDVYPEQNMDINIYPISFDPTVDNKGVKLALTAGKWNSFDIPVSDFDGVNFAKLGQFKFDGGSGQTLYIDNLYLWKSGSDPDPVDPTPGEDGDGCTYKGTASDGQGLKDGYTMEFSTVDGKVVVRIKYDGDYDDAVEPYIQTTLSGELGRATAESDGWYTFTVASPVSGNTYRSMMPYAGGGQAFTAYYAYNPGQSCGDVTGMIGEIPDDQIALYPNPSHDVVTVEVPGLCRVMIYSPAGALVYDAMVDSRATVAVDAWAAGIYFVRFVDAVGNSNGLSLIKR